MHQVYKRSCNIPSTPQKNKTHNTLDQEKFKEENTNVILRLMPL